MKRGTNNKLIEFWNNYHQIIISGIVFGISFFIISVIPLFQEPPSLNGSLFLDCGKLDIDCPITGSFVDLLIMPLYFLAGSPMGDEGMGFVMLLPFYNAFIGVLIGVIISLGIKKIKKRKSSS